ncbi:hypothetical protein RN001_014755 [Aquatica leii]|uniref:Uncharacterized protein n=1 Tax=Aquatica leii TaxID=1421715 RepID=A0AAN7P014_9COLE|nr:hypothetical protein RN001_014755 [Aquatica leii]
MAKSPVLNTFFFTEEIVTDAVIVRRTFYQEVSDKKIIETSYKYSGSPTYNEPMDVDSSTDLTNSIIDTKNEDKDTCLKQRFNLRLKDKSLDTASRYKVSHSTHVTTIVKLLLIFFVLLSTFLICFFKSTDLYLHLNPEIQFEDIKNALKEKILNQEEVVLTIGHNLDDLIETQLPKLLVFVGTTGVGKTYVANVMKSFYLQEHVHEVLPENLPNVESHMAIVSNLDPYCYNLILIDNLRASHLDALTSFVRMLPDDYKLLIITIFNVHDTVNGVHYTINADDYNLIRYKIDKLQMDFEFVVFRQLDQDVVKNWLKNRLHEKGVDSTRHDTLIEYMLRKNYVKNNGFKGLDAKLSLIDNV